MRLNDLLKELENQFRCEVKNGNEVYIDVKKELIRDIVKEMFVKYKLYFVAEFCVDNRENFTINVVLSNRKNGYYVVIRYTTDEDIISLEGIAHQCALFEREIQDLFGLKINGGIDTRNIVKHEIWQDKVYPLRKDFKFKDKVKDSYEIPEYKFKEIKGDGAYQIPVGPVHAGIIEPGHFRFSVIGEDIENLEIRLMYKHRGIEKLCENVSADKLNLVFERVAGESSVAYGEAYALLIEKMLGIEVPKDIKIVRTILLELERIYNFLDDIAGICVDVGYSYPAKKYSYLSEQIHQLCEKISGSRFLRNSIVPGGVNIHITTEKKNIILDTIKNVKERFEGIVEMTLNSVSFLDRVEITGIVENETAKKLLMTGVVGRASGIRYDVRHSFPYEMYGEIKKNINFETIGGVFERYKIKIAEINDAFNFIETLCKQINEVNKQKIKIELPNNKEALASVETVKGELVLYGKTGQDNKFERIYFKTPSFTNWNGLTYAVLGEIVPDFPLCNKSFNMSYSENDR